jgi:adhesin transport system membrane fusion protein
MANMRQQQQLAARELQIAKPLLNTGASTETEILRLQQRLAELTTKVEAMRSEYFVNLKNDLSKTMSELDPLLKVAEGRKDQLQRTLITSPVHGVVEDIHVTTIGGVVSSGGILMKIVPLDDKLLVETRINPRDIAFIHPGQEAVVKVTAYDSSIYGSLKSRVESISSDTLADEVDRRIVYYRVYVLTDQAYLETRDGKRHPIMPGMVTTTEIRTGAKTVFTYLIKPLNRAREALRER